MQEEGWVVCRAFKKPSPNHRQGFEAWTRAYYARDNSQVRPPSFPDLVAAQGGHPNQAATFHQPIGSLQQEFFCGHSLLDDQLIEIPQLDSPSTLSTSLATKDGFQRIGVAVEDYDEERSTISSQYLDWKNLDDLLANGTTPFPLPNLPSISPNNEIGAQNNGSHLLGCLPDL